MLQLLQSQCGVGLVLSIQDPILGVRSTGVENVAEDIGARACNARQLGDEPHDDVVKRSLRAEIVENVKFDFAKACYALTIAHKIPYRGG